MWPQRGYKLAVQHLKEAYEANRHTTVEEAIEWLEDNSRYCKVEQVPERVEGDEELEEWVEKIARCRYTGNPKTFHSEESYKTTLTIVLAKLLATKNTQCDARVREAVTAERERIANELIAYSHQSGEKIINIWHCAQVIKKSNSRDDFELEYGQVA